MVDKKETNDKSEASSVKPSWIKMKPTELEKIVIDLAKAGEDPAKIGLILRDKYGIPKAKLLGKKISVILKENKVDFRGKKEIYSAHIEKLKRHTAKNKHDYPAARAITKRLWTVHKIEIGKAS